MDHLTDEQWTLIQPLLPPIPARGRPPIDQRLVLEGILWKFSLLRPWYDLPSAYPSYQTCYRRYLLWKRTGLLDQIIALLLNDLRDRGGFDLALAVEENRISFSKVAGRWVIKYPPDIEGTWQHTTARLLISLFLLDALQRLKHNPKVSLGPASFLIG